MTLKLYTGKMSTFGYW